MTDLFGERQYTVEEKHKAAVRELEMRRAVYPKLVQAKKKSKESSDYEIGVMQAIVNDYAKAIARKAAAGSAGKPGI